MRDSLTILVAGERVAARELGELIQRWGHQVELVHDGPAAIRQARQGKPDLILLELGLPGLNGMAVAQELRREEACRGAKLGALVERSTRLPALEVSQAGFHFQLLKPLDPLRLLSSIVAARDAKRSARDWESARAAAAAHVGRIERLRSPPLEDQSAQMAAEEAESNRKRPAK